MDTDLLLALTALVLGLVLGAVLGGRAGLVRGRSAAAASVRSTAQAEVDGARAESSRALASLATQNAVAESAWATESDLLRARIGDLEVALAGSQHAGTALAPLAEALVRVESQVGRLERDRVQQFAGLRSQLGQVNETGEALRVQTAALVGALRSPNARGAWGEVQLKRVVEHAGMLSRVDFAEQATGTTSSGTGARPDLVVRLPGGKNLVVDAKSPLASFLQASEQTDPARREALLTQHARSVKGHVDALAAKEYWTAFDPSPELVICFVPGEAFLAAACAADPTLLEHAMARRVVLATPTTLLTVLRTVALVWQQDALSGSAQELFDVGRELYRRLGTLGGHTDKLGRDLARAVEDYNKLVATLESRVLVSARKMADLDVTDGEIPPVAPLDALPRPLRAPELLLRPESPDEDEQDEQYVRRAG